MLLTALITNSEARVAIYSCPDLELTILQKDGGSLDRSILTYEEAALVILQPHDPILLTLWANYIGSITQESLGDFEVEVVSTNVCSQYLPEGGLDILSYEYGSEDLQINLTVSENVHNWCDLSYSCQFLDE